VAITFSAPDSSFWACSSTCTSIWEGSAVAGGGEAAGEDSGSSSTIALALKRKEVNLVTEKIKVLKNEKKGE
jgi:hypothetical protein